MSGKRAVIIGSGIGGLAAACLLGKAGYRVTVLEKNAQLGGRAGQLKTNGFTFDTGPSWYLMPEVFERFFELLGEQVERHLKLIKLSRSYRVFYKGEGQPLDIASDLAIDSATFDRIEPGAGRQLERYLQGASQTYHAAMQHFLYRNYGGLRSFGLPAPVLLHAATSVPLGHLHEYVQRFFTDQRLQQILEFPAVFLGTSPYQAPAIYSLLSHADMTQGVFYPMGGMYELVRTLTRLGQGYGAEYRTDATVEKIRVRQGVAQGVVVNGQEVPADIVISNADMHHTETALLPPALRGHSARYWQRRTLAPSALLLYIGVRRRLDSLAHHNLLFSRNWRQNFTELFGGHHFPTDPSLYVCAPSKTDPSVAPGGCENLFVLVPVAAGLQYTDEQLAAFTEHILQTIETELYCPQLRKHIVQLHSFCVRNFASTFNSFRGTGLGLSHTLRQSAMFRPRNVSRKVHNLYFVGANVHPGIGLPTALISAELLMRRL